jgi:MFS family permease
MGVGLGLSMGVLGSLGTWLGGQVSDRFGAKDPRTLMLLPATVGVFMAGILCVAFTTDNAALGLLLIGVNSGLGAMTLAPVFATTQGLVPPRIRPTATAMLFLIVNLVGMGLGPIGVGLLSDVLAGPGGLGSAEGIRWALIASTLMGLVATGLYLLARRTITSEMES